MRVLFLAVLLLAASATPAESQYWSCSTYFPDSETAPPEARELLERAPNAAVNVCSDIREPDEKSYDFVSSPLRGVLGVCQITERRVFKGKDGWTHNPPPDKPYRGGPTVSMLLAEGDCPRQNNPRYIVTNHVSEGVFAAAVKFWRELSSGVGQETLFAAVDPIVQSNPRFREFEAAVRSGSVFKLVSVNLDSGWHDKTVHYRFHLDGSPKNFSLKFDFDENGLVVLGIGEYVY